MAGEPVHLARYRSRVLLIVSTANACGFTPQYRGRKKVYRQFKDWGVLVLGFPCNQIGAQEPGSAAEITAFAKRTTA